MFKHDERCTFCVRQMFCWKNSFVCIAMAFCFWALCSWHLLHWHTLHHHRHLFPLAPKSTKIRERKKERETEKTTASNCIDQHQPLFLLFIFDFVRLCRWFFGSWKSFSLQCNASKNKSICCYFTWNENESSGFSIKNLFDKRNFSSWQMFMLEIMKIKNDFLCCFHAQILIKSIEWWI